MVCKRIAGGFACGPSKKAITKTGKIEGNGASLVESMFGQLRKRFSRRVVGTTPRCSSLVLMVGPMIFIFRVRRRGKWKFTHATRKQLMLF